jgi:tetratricopeptide (TPR) repeat protein
MKNYSDNGGKASDEMLVIPSADTEQEAHQHHAAGPRSFLKGLGIAGASLLPASADTLRRSLYLGFYLLSVGTAAAMGSGSGGSSGSVASTPLQREVGSSAFKVYNQGVDLMRAKKFAAAQIKFEQAIRDNPDFAEAHNNLGFTLRQQGPQNYAKALEHYNKAIQLKPNMAETYEYRGVLFAKMGKKSDAEKDLVALKKLNLKLADELAEFLKTGKEEDEYAPTSPKQKS